MVDPNRFPRSIMITDDHSIIRRTLRDWLSDEFPGIQVLETSSGEAALERLDSEPLPQMILMDFHLPGKSGISTIQKIKQHYPDLPIVMLTIQEDKHYRDRALQAGADAYVVKRRMYTDLIPAVEAAYGGGSSGKEE